MFLEFSSSEAGCNQATLGLGTFVTYGTYGGIRLPPPPGGFGAPPPPLHPPLGTVYDKSGCGNGGFVTATGSASVPWYDTPPALQLQQTTGGAGSYSTGVFNGEW